MKNILEAKRPKRHRPSPRLLLLVVGAVLLSTLGFAQPANAQGFLGQKKETKSFFSVKQNEVKLKELDVDFRSTKQKIDDKAKTVESVVKEAETVSQTKEQMEAEIASIKSELAELDDMFVKVNRYAPNAGGNTYAPGNCTWYVKSMRPDIPNQLGNANTWYANAKAQGWNVGTKAKVGAVATTTAGGLGHVAYVEKVSRNGQWVTISEMNYGQLYRMNVRTVPASEFRYIYELN